MRYINWRLLLLKYFSYVQYVDAFRRYSRSKSKVVRKRPEFWTFFFALPNFRGQAFQKLYPFYHPRLPARPLEKVLWDTPTSLEVIGPHTLNFKPNFKFSRLNFLGGAPSQLWFALASVGQTVSHVKIWGGRTPQGSKYSLPKNVRLGGSVWAPITRLFVEQSPQNFFYPTWKGL